MSSEFSTCQVDDFFKSYLPDHRMHFDAVIADLKKQKTLVDRSPSQQKRSRSSSSKNRPAFSHVFKTLNNLFQTGSAAPNRILKSFQTVGNAVRKALGKAKAPTNERGIRVDESSENGASAYLTTNLRSPAHLTDVVVPIEITTSKETKIMTHAAMILNRDARREFSYAVTIENQNLSVWYLSRAVAVKSKPFDMQQHADLLVQLLVSLFCSSNEQLGYDPLVTLLPDRSFVYQFPPDGDRTFPLFYRTLEVICDRQSAHLCERQSRVWKVEQVTSASDPQRVLGTSTMVLKDSSIDALAPVESDVQDRLFGDITDFARSKNWRSHPLLKDANNDDLHALGEALKGDNFKQFFSCIVSKHVSLIDPISNMDQGTDRHRRVRLVYENVCTALHDIPTLGEAIDIVKQTLLGLCLMFCAGWVHRDLSPGNILAFRATLNSPWHAKISDLEFARRFPASGVVTVSEQLTGTPHFMAYELLHSRHLLPKYTPTGERFPIDPESLVIHNYQHDLESIWWIILWLVGTRVKEKLPRTFSEMFQQHVNGPYAKARHYVLTYPLTRAGDLLRSLPQSLRSSAFLNALDTLRQDLHHQYIARNGDNRQSDIGSYSWIISKAFPRFLASIEPSRDEWGAIALIVESERRERRRKKQEARRQQQLSQPPDHPVQPKKRKAEADRNELPSKRTRRHVPAVAVRQGGPVTRSMTRNARPMTRSVARQLEQAKSSQHR
ncbi:other/FunK1 protein kinase [Coprinopsis cinerea okayama7|uniref:Other/FunK1 protein kinase n=1 Tax=Coprinopsis cinerea (strain Okayama-7 / 130 / ATCC MYA-4618 / FGSC 9003) TaxID=240176 RepID=A8NAY0_COPC7|nr:other/FunK1 protein kinase [Coprinopsis cinerea okayama7\|eukprot:XP_001831982.2 other/FunK1 protein kinase [Coprinopsis cinerea okayama7\